MNLEEMKKRKDEFITSQNEMPDDIQGVKGDLQRLIGITQNSEEILDKIDEEFEKITAIDKTDMVFLFFAVMLQTARWIISEKLDLSKDSANRPTVDKNSRLSSNERNHSGGIYDGKSSGTFYENEKLRNARKDFKEKAKESQEEFYRGENKYRSWIEIMTQPVPYDAMNSDGQGEIPSIAGLNRKGKNQKYNNISGKNHHVATLGHDPVLGWIFGTANIMSSTITFVNLLNFEVIRYSTNTFDIMKSKELAFSNQAIDYSHPVSMHSLFMECYMSMEEDIKRLPAAIIRQAIHFESDKYCKQGLPIPLLSSINPQKAQELIEKGWNSVEFSKRVHDLKIVGENALFSYLVNAVIEAIYLFCFDSNDDIEIRKVKIKKILSLANAISSSSNIIFVLATKEFKKLDIGGIGIALLSSFNSTRFIGAVKREYIENNFRKLVQGIAE